MDVFKHLPIYDRERIYAFVLQSIREEHEKKFKSTLEAIKARKRTTWYDQPKYINLETWRKKVALSRSQGFMKALSHQLYLGFMRPSPYGRYINSINVKWP